MADRDWKKVFVLIVEDQVHYSMALRDKLGSTFSVGVARNGEAGLARIQEESDRWDVVLCDYMMPGMCGDEAIKGMREVNKTVPIVAISSEENRKLMAAGATVAQEKITILLKTAEAKEDWINLIKSLVEKYPQKKEVGHE